MNVEEAVRDTFRAMSGQSLPPVPPDLADRVLRRRRRRRAGGVTALVVVMAAVVAVSAWLPALTAGHRGGPAHRTTGAPDVLAHPHQSPPSDLIAAGRTAMSAYTVTTNDEQPDGDIVLNHHWHLYNPSAGRYQATDWAWADVAPGLRKAAVLAGPLPQRRVGVLDLTSGTVTRWIDLPKAAASVYWSPDGRRLLLTTYSHNPDRRFKDHQVNVNGKDQPTFVPGRTGFEVVDVASGHARWHANPPFKDFPMPLVGRDDLRWSRDGSLVWAHTHTTPTRRYFDLEGQKVAAPVGEDQVFSEAGRSPDGRYTAGGFVGTNGKIATVVLDARTGRPVARQPVQELLVWADDHRLIAWGCGSATCAKGEYHQQLVLVDVQGKHVRQLSSFRTSGHKGSWEPHFSPR